MKKFFQLFLMLTMVFVAGCFSSKVQTGVNQFGVPNHDCCGKWTCCDREACCAEVDGKWVCKDKKCPKISKSK